MTNPAVQSANSFVMLPSLAGVAGEGPFTFLLDTGATPSAIDTELARRLGLPLDQNNAIPASGAGSETVYIYPTRIEALRIAGNALFENFVVTFDYTGNQVYLQKAEPGNDAP